MGTQNGHNVPFLESASLEMFMNKQVLRILEMTRHAPKYTANVSAYT